MLQHNTKLIFLFALLVLHSYAFVCPPDFCANVTCDPIEKCEKGQILKQGGVCNCCKYCVTILEESHTCIPPSPILGVSLPKQECNEGLVCIDGVCKKIKALNEVSMEVLQ